MRSRFVKLSLRSSELGGVPEDAVWATRGDPLNTRRLRDDAYVGQFRFVVAYMVGLDYGAELVWTDYKMTWEEATASLDEARAKGRPASAFAILPAGFKE